MLAQAAGDVPSDLWRLGVVAVALLVGAAVVYRWVVVPERARADRYEADLREANRAMAEKWLPALDAASRALERRSGRT